jgi:hypothetical protein
MCRLQATVSMLAETVLAYLMDNVRDATTKRFTLSFSSYNKQDMKMTKK